MLLSIPIIVASLFKQVLYFNTKVLGISLNRSVIIAESIYIALH